MRLLVGWDWYSCTLTGIFDAQLVTQKLAPGGAWRAGGAKQNYPASYALSLASGGSVQVWFGGSLEVHVVLTSAACDSLVDLVRSTWPHRVSRADAACDFDFPGAFDALFPQLIELANTRKPNRVAVDRHGPWFDGDDKTQGRTVYLGKRQSRWFGRFYEKGLEQRKKHPDQEFSSDWVRAEAEVKPSSSEHKSQLSTMTPVEAFASTAFGAAVLELLTGAVVESVPLHRNPSTDPEYWLARQYHPVLTLWLGLDDSELRARIVATLERASSRPAALVDS